MINKTVGLKYTPMLMSGPLAIPTLKGLKTQTRRVINPQPSLCDTTMTPRFEAGCVCDTYEKNEGPCISFELGMSGRCVYCDHGISCHELIKCPYGKVGDRIWIKETHYLYARWNKNGFTKTGKQKWKFQEMHPQYPTHEIVAKPVYYCDTLPNELAVRLNSYRKAGWYKRSSIFMKREYSRITVEITKIRVQFVQDISEEDAENEGIGFLRDIPDADETLTAKELFMCLWNSINEKRDFGWDVDPWVWAITFKVI